MSRSFGDLRLKEPKHLVISDPEIRVEQLTPKDEFVILASGIEFACLCNVIKMVCGMY
jgi:hypothetical protein